VQACCLTILQESINDLAEVLSGYKREFTKRRPTTGSQGKRIRSVARVRVIVESVSGRCRRCQRGWEQRAGDLEGGGVLLRTGGLVAALRPFRFFMKLPELPAAKYRLVNGMPGGGGKEKSTIGPDRAHDAPVAQPSRDPPSRSEAWRERGSRHLLSRNAWARRVVEMDLRAGHFYEASRRGIRLRSVLSGLGPIALLRAVRLAQSGNLPTILNTRLSPTFRRGA